MARCGTGRGQYEGVNRIRRLLSGRFVAAKVWAHRRFVARTGMKPVSLVLGVVGLRRALRTGRNVEVVASRLTRGWGNPRYAASPDLVATVIREAARSDGAMAECGSGVTTIVLASARKHLGAEAITFENDEMWAATVRRRLRALRLPHDGVLHRPLVERPEYDWYDVRPGDLSGGVGFLLCDGPPASTRGGRTGVIELVETARPAVVVLDDTDRVAERELCGRLEARDYSTDSRSARPSGAYVVLRAERAAADA